MLPPLSAPCARGVCVRCARNVAVKELRELRERLLQLTSELSVDAALAAVEVAIRERAELRSAEAAFGQTLGADGWRGVAAEVEAGRHLEGRIRAFAGVATGAGTSLEASLRTLQHRERERLALVQVRDLPPIVDTYGRDRSHLAPSSY